MPPSPLSPGNSAVLLVDFQEDFTEIKKGPLAVPGTDRDYINAVVGATRAFARKGRPIFATQDWHPSNHMSFSTNHPGTQPFDTLEIKGRTQVLWPPHCIQHTAGASIMMDNDLFEKVVQKGTDPQFDSYSGFADDGGKKTGLKAILRQADITALLIYGLATDFCVKFTVLDAIREGFRVQLVNDLCRGISPDGTRAAINEMRAKGVLITPTAAPLV